MSQRLFVILLSGILSLIYPLEWAGSASEINSEDFNTQVKSMQQSIAEDQEKFKEVLSLLDDRDFYEAMIDPKIVAAVQSGNYQELLSNEKFKKLLDHSAVKKIKARLPKV